MSTAVEQGSYEIRPPKRGLAFGFADLFRDRDILWALVSRNVKVRYKQALAGPAWAVFQPLLTVAIFTVIFGRVAQLPTDGVPHFVFYLSGFLIWTFFASALAGAAGSLAENSSLISKIYLPRSFLPLAAILASVVDLGVSAVITFPLIYIFGGTLTLNALFLPVPILLTLFAVTGLGLGLGALNARYRDVKFIVPFLIQAGLFLSPVAFSSSLVHGDWIYLYACNPMYGAIEGFRWASTGSSAVELWPFVVSAASSLVTLIGGFIMFNQMDKTLADVV